MLDEMNMYNLDTNMDPYPWTAMVVTCSTSKVALAIKTELEFLQMRRKIHQSTMLLTVEDPEKNIGSGGATLNAILMATEHISAKRGFNVLNSDVLLDSHLLILHNGRSSIFDVCGKAFLSLPDRRTNLEHVVDVVQRLARDAKRKGVWVCSTDMLLLSTGRARSYPLPPADAVLFSSLATPEYGTGHGVLKLVSGRGDADSPCERVADILYCRPIEDVKTLRWRNSGKVPIVCGLVYLSPALSGTLLSLHDRTPLGSCTYLGTDSGADPVRVSLFFDILAVMAEDISQKAFLDGECGKTYGMRHSYVQNEITEKARALVWKTLRRFKLGTVILEDTEYLYLPDQTTGAEYSRILQSFNRNGIDVGDGPLVINSVVGENVSLPPKPSFCLIQNCLLKCSPDRPIRFGRNTIASGIDLDIRVSTRRLELKDNLTLIVARIDREGCAASVPILFGTYDNWTTPVARSSATFCNVDWTTFHTNTGIQSVDIWDEVLVEEQKSLYNANLFPVNGTIEDVLWWSNSDDRESRLDSWRSATRVSLREIMALIDPFAEFSHRRLVGSAGAIRRVRLALSEDREDSLDPLFCSAVAEGWADRMLAVLDRLAMELDGQPGRAARVLGNIANLLGCMAAGDGGLRSGPAANRDWISAFETFEKNVPGSIRDGVVALRNVRTKWMNAGPHRLMRAARHYEGAAQILIRHAIFTSQQNIFVESRSKIPEMGIWVSCQCPARIDLFGGWTDTPPICYELGGSVVNASILVDGKRPIGAKVRRIVEPLVVICSDEGSKLTLGEIEDLADYNRPTNPGALAKACLVWTEVVRLDSEICLREQLLGKFGGGLEMHTWSNLPQGSGLGTSSIMAGAIIAALWSMAGKVYDKKALIHGVLCIEQMLTTGGGWQDQVGGLTGGFVHGQTLPGLPLLVRVDELNLRPEFVLRLERHFALIYTGTIRLAKNLLQNVLRNWFARDALMLGTFQSLRKKSFDFVEALKEENLSKIGELMNEYWSLKKILAPGAEPAGVRSIMEALRPHSYGRLLCGAGGGGFMVVLLKDPDDPTIIDDVISNSQNSGVSKYELTIDSQGISVNIGDERVDIR